MATFQGAQSKSHLQQILALQAANLPKSISPEEALEQGFLTVEHQLDILSEMNEPYAHTVALDGDQVVGYALTMTSVFRKRIPILEPFFDLVDSLRWNGSLLGESSYVLMGQVCVAKAYRGQGVFSGLYSCMQTRLAPHFEAIVTEISERNTRSLRAHAKAGFTDIYRYTSPGGERWVVVGLSTK